MSTDELKPMAAPEPTPEEQFLSLSEALISNIEWDDVDPRDVSEMLLLMAYKYHQQKDMQEALQPVYFDEVDQS